MIENKALTRVLQQKSHSIPLGVRYWAFYKGAVLEHDDVRLGSVAEATNIESFKEAMKPLMKRSPFRPSTKRSRRTCEILNRDMLSVAFEYHKVLLGESDDVPWEVCNTQFGLGLCAKQDFEWNTEHSRLLFGVVCDVADDDFQVLQQQDYPSLFASRATGNGILFGPASLLNHACNAPLKWGSPSKRGRPPSEHFEDLNCLRLQTRSKKKVKFAKGDIISVRYGMHRKNFVCQCADCL
jgi:hypothetical protein